MLKKLCSLTLCAAFLLSLTACSDMDSSEAPPPSPFPVQVKGITLEAQPQRIVSLSPALTEMVFEIGHGESLIGRSSYCEYPPQVSSVESVGSAAHPDLEAITAAAPDLLLTQSPMAKKDIVALENAGIPVCILPSPASLKELEEAYGTLGMLLEGIDGDIKGESVFTPIASAIALTGGSKTDSFVYITSPDFAVATGDTFESDILSHFGTNIAQQATGYSFTPEEIVEADPSIIFLSADVPSETLLSDPVLSVLSAVQAGRVYTLESRYFERPTNRLTELIGQIRSTFASISSSSNEPAVPLETEVEETETVE